MKHRPGAALVLALAAAACGRAATAGPQSPTPAAASAQAPAAAAPTGADTTASPAAAAAPASAAVSTNAAPGGSSLTSAQFEALYRARADSARHVYAPADIQFMEGMIHHHAQAIVMALMAPSHGASASLRTLCARIINAQTDEIHTMQGWLRDRGQPAPQVDASGTVTMPGDSAGMGMHHDMPGMNMGHGAGASMPLMPGMLTQAQMDQLSRARGQEFDRLFLTFMIQHHSGAITMVHDLFATDGAGQEQTVFKLASDVQVDQTTEIARMRRMLAQMALSGQGM